MINALIFDFGDVFINLDKEGAMRKALNAFGLNSLKPEMLETNQLYEKGEISTQAFIDFYTDRFPNISRHQLIEIWNCIITDFPKYRLDFLTKLSNSKRFKLILLSNTNELHIRHVKEVVPFYKTFKSRFDAFYLSHEIHKRKPDPDIFHHVLREQQLSAVNCLFIDDTLEHIETARQLGFETWNIDETKEDVTQLFDKRKDLF